VNTRQAQCINNLGEVLKASGASWENVVKVNVYLKDMDNFAKMNEVYEKVGFEDEGYHR
jgi:enamine deaminase RidA (YjgF/YER057c/UK114 family)